MHGTVCPGFYRYYHEELETDMNKKQKMHGLYSLLAAGLLCAALCLTGCPEPGGIWSDGTRGSKTPHWNRESDTTAADPSSNVPSSGECLTEEEASTQEAGTPTDAPAVPTDAANVPTEGPASPTDAPDLPTDGPASPTDAPDLPTDGPASPRMRPQSPQSLRPKRRPNPGRPRIPTCRTWRSTASCTVPIKTMRSC